MTKNHRKIFETQLCRRDYDLMAEHHPALLDSIEDAIGAGVLPYELKRWAMGTVTEPAIVQRCVNAARYVAEAME